MADLHDFQCHSHKVGTVGDKLILGDHIPVRLVIDCPRKKQLQITLSSVDGLRNTPFMFCALYEVHRTIFTMSTDNQGLLSMIRRRGNILDIAQAICTRSNRVLGFVHQYRVHLLMKCLCRSANSCEVGLIVVHCVSFASLSVNVFFNDSKHALGFVSPHGVHSLMKGNCRTAHSCKAGHIVGARRIACNGLCTAASIHSTDENPGCLLGCGEGPDCLRHCNQCLAVFRSLLAIWLGTGECISPTAILK